MPFFSIIMPAYGVDKYIKKAIKSVQNQTFTDWELIVVDDATPDDSGKIAEHMAKSDSRIQVVHHTKNQGLSAARNTGESHATGSYIWYMDSDDYVDCDLLEQVYESIEKNPAQIVVFGLMEEYYTKEGAFRYGHKVVPKQAYYKTKEDLRDDIIYLEQATLYGYAWNKFYDLKYLREQKLQFDNVKLIEDIVFNVKFCMDIECMNTLSIAPYHYAKRLDNSLTNKFVSDYYTLHKRRIELLYDQHKYWNHCTPEAMQILGGLYARYILSTLQRNCDPRAKMTHAERYQWCNELFGDGLFNTLIPVGKAAESKSLSVALLFFRWKRGMMCLTMGRVVYMIRMKLPMLYSKVKSER